MKKKVWKFGKCLLLSLVMAAAVSMAAKTEVKAGTSFATADTITVGQRVENDFTSGNNASKYYKFTTDGRKSYFGVNFGNDNSCWKNIKIYTGNSSSYSKVLDESRSRSGNSSYVIKLDSNHTYYIECGCDDYNTSGKSNFTITQIPDDYGDVLSSGKAISLGQTVEGKIEVAGKNECDTFRFTTSGYNSFYEMSISTTAADTETEVYIYDGPDESYSHRNISAYSGNTKTKVERLEKNHTYYVKIVGGYWDQATAYKFRVKEIRDDAGDDFSNATTIKNKALNNKTLQVSSDVDFFKFKTAKSQTMYQFYFKNKSQNSVYVTIYSNDDIASAISSVKDMYVGSASTKTIWLNLKKNRTYYIKVTGGDNCSYGVQMKDLKSYVKTTAPASFKAKGYSGWFSRYATLSWNNKAVNGKYEIYRSTNPKADLKRIKTVKCTGTGTYSYTDYSVKKKHTYYYKIRYCVTENKKVCTAKWSKVKKVKIK